MDSSTTNIILYQYSSILNFGLANYLGELNFNNNFINDYIYCNLSLSH